MNTPLPIHDPAARRAFANHPRLWHDHHYVYAVLSRRSKGVSIGVNLNTDKVCNFDCVYCSIDRKVPLPAWAARRVDMGVLREELAAMLELARSGAIYSFPPFEGIPAALRRINDIAFSGDGEPTTCPQLKEVVELAAEAATAEPIKLVLITNASMFHKPAVREVLAFLDGHHGEIWAKLDAGTVEHFRKIDRSGVPFHRIVENVTWCCQTRPTVIQTLLMKINGAGPSAEELAAYVSRLEAIKAAGGVIKLVQLYTVARHAAEAYVSPLTGAELEAAARMVGRAGIPVEIYP